MGIYICDDGWNREESTVPVNQRFSNFFGQRPLVNNLPSIPPPSRKSQYFATFVFV